MVLDEAAISRAFRWAADHGADVISCSPKVIAVAATTDQDRRAWYGDYGKAISVSAPSSGGRNGIWTTEPRTANRVTAGIRARGVG